MATCQSLVQNAGQASLLKNATPSTPSLNCRSQALLPGRRCSRQAVAKAHLLQHSSSYVGRRIAMPAPCAKREVNRIGRGLEVTAAKRKDKERSLVLTVTLAAEEGKEEKVQALCRGIVEHFRPMVADSKSPVRAFECSQDAYEPNVYHFWQRYDGFVEMNDVYAGPEYSKFLEEVRPLLKGPVALAAYEWVNGQLGHMMNPIGPKGEGGLDDATGQGGSGGGASYKQTAQTDLGNVERESWGMESMQKGIDKVKNMLGLDNLLSGKK